jgi:NAD(P)-dependent dehydrogenase (short-subunit alcohol dehydrogenase family)
MFADELPALPFKAVSPADLFSVKGQHCLVTGGGRGIGLMAAAALVAGGARFIALVGRDQTVLDAARDSLLAWHEANTEEKDLGASVDVICIPTDLQPIDNCLALQDKVREALSSCGLPEHLDCVVNNAGAVWGAGFDDFPPDGWDKVMNLNVRSVFFVTRALVPLLEAARDVHPRGYGGSVINVASIAGQVPMPLGTYSYTASKSAVIHLTKHLASHLAERKIRVNCFCPGTVPTKMMRGTIEAAGEKEMRETIPLGRFAEPGDMAACVLLFASRASEWMTGAVLTADGGEIVRTRPANL